MNEPDKCPICNGVCHVREVMWLDGEPRFSVRCSRCNYGTRAIRRKGDAIKMHNDWCGTLRQNRNKKVLAMASRFRTTITKLKAEVRQLQLELNRGGGFSLIELVVVLGIIGILASLAIGGAGMWQRSDEDRMAQTLHSMLRAARTYATSQNRLCAVGYLEGEPVTDTVTGNQVRPLVAAALLYQTPDKGYDILPGSGVEGWMKFPLGLCILPYRAPAYLDGPAEFKTGTADIGLMPVVMYGVEGRVLAHVFRNRGELASGGEKQRYPMWIGAVPEAPLSERLWEAAGNWTGSTPITADPGMVRAWADDNILPAKADLGLIGRGITIWKAGGRVATVELKERD